MAIKDYDHHNEEAAIWWWAEEGRYAGDEEPSYDDVPDGDWEDCSDWDD